MDEKLRILLCEDDENLGMLLREYLQAKGYAAELYPDGEAGYKAFLKNKYDLCVFDVMMPKKDGFTLAQEVRAANAEIPIIFLTAKTLKEDILEGFKIGADDYITKPFSMEELTFRIEAILRRVRGKKNKESNIYKIGKFTFDTQKQILATAEKQTKLTTKESELLGLSLKVALHNSCCVTPSFSHKKMRTVHCSGVISKPFWRKLRDSFRLMAADTLPFSMAKIRRISKLNCSIMKLLFKQLCKDSASRRQFLYPYTKKH